MTVADESGSHGHHLPAVEDWPRGFGEASWWPFITAIGASGFYVAAALYVLGRGQDPLVPSIVGPAAFVGTTFVFLGGLYGWLYHAFIVDFWEGVPSHVGESKLRWGMILFLGTEIATFGAGFVYYFFIRVGAWDTAQLPHDGNLLGGLILLNTSILVLSSFTLHWAHVELLKDNHRNFVRGLAVTLLLGLVFIAGQIWEYVEFIGNEGFFITTTEGLEKAFASAFFGLTGLHGLHVSLGAVLLAILLVRALYGQYSAERHVSVSTVSMYWHFVDAVWIFLVVVIYAGAAL